MSARHPPIRNHFGSKWPCGECQWISANVQTWKLISWPNKFWHSSWLFQTHKGQTIRNKSQFINLWNSSAYGVVYPERLLLCSTLNGDTERKGNNTSGETFFTTSTRLGFDWVHCLTTLSTLLLGNVNVYKSCRWMIVSVVEPSLQYELALLWVAKAKVAKVSWSSQLTSLLKNHSFFDNFV